MRIILDETLLAESFVITKLALYFHENNIENFIHESKIKPSYPYDISYFGKRFDVKFSNPVIVNRTRHQRVWDFDIRGKSDYCDYFVLLGVRHNRPDTLFLINAKNAPKHHIRISIVGKTKYNANVIWKYI